MAGEKVAEIIAQHGAAGRTGTAMVVFEDNSLGRFYIVGGMLATARYRNKQGREAMREAVARTVVSTKFHEDADLVRSAELIEEHLAPEPAAPVRRRPAAPTQQLSGPLLTRAMRSGNYRSIGRIYWSGSTSGGSRST